MLKMSTGIRSALNKLERATDLVTLHNSVAESLLHRGIVVETVLRRFELTDKGHSLIAAMNDPNLTPEAVQRIYG